MVVGVGVVGAGVSCFLLTEIQVKTNTNLVQPLNLYKPFPASFFLRMSVMTTKGAFFLWRKRAIAFTFLSAI